MFSYHTHSLFCDGKASIDQFCLDAIALGYRDLAFTSHAPVPFENNYALRFEQLSNYKAAVLAAKAKYSGKINIYFGLESDYIPNITIDFDQWRRMLDTDFIVGSVHYVIDPLTHKRWFIDGAPNNFVEGMEEIFKGNWQRAVSAYFNQVRQMISTQKPDIIGHIDKVKMNNQDHYFKTTDPLFVQEYNQTIELVKQVGGIVEINARGIYRKKYHECFPHVAGIHKCMELGVPMTLASDAHHPSELTIGFELAINTAREAKLPSVYLFSGQGWEPFNLNSVSTKK